MSLCIRSIAVAYQLRIHSTNFNVHFHYLHNIFLVPILGKQISLIRLHSTIGERKNMLFWIKIAESCKSKRKKMNVIFKECFKWSNKYSRLTYKIKQVYLTDFHLLYRQINRLNKNWSYQLQNFRWDLFSVKHGPKFHEAK